MSKKRQKDKARLPGMVQFVKTSAHGRNQKDFQAGMSCAHALVMMVSGLSQHARRRLNYILLYTSIVGLPALKPPKKRK